MLNEFYCHTAQDNHWGLKPLCWCNDIVNTSVSRSRDLELLFQRNLATTQHKNVEGLESCRIIKLGCFDKIRKEILLIKRFQKWSTWWIHQEFDKMVSVSCWMISTDYICLMPKLIMNGKFPMELMDNRIGNGSFDGEETWRKTSIFFAVGSGHLGGENGVSQSSENQGYQVKKLIDNPKIGLFSSKALNFGNYRSLIPV